MELLRDGLSFYLHICVLGLLLVSFSFMLLRPTYRKNKAVMASFH
jgi:preprotein translocase subunit YajC